MPEAENHTQSMAVGSVEAYEMPVEMGRPLTIKPDGVRASANPPNIKLVPKGKEKILTKNSILAMHTLNLPFKERLLMGEVWYKKLLAIVEKFDYEHEREFFEVYRELLVAKDTEDWPSMTTNEVLYFRRMLVKRLVNRLLAYYEGMLALDGAFANLTILSNVNGTGRFKTFGLACKWSYINTASNTFDDFIQPKGAVDYIGKYSKFCVGETNQQTVFVSIPEWAVDVFGNRGQHTFNWSDIIASWSMDGDKFWLPETSAPDAETYSKLLVNMTRTITRYGQDVSLEDDQGNMHHATAVADDINPANDKTVVMSVSHLENGAALTMVDKAVESDTWTMNADTSVIYKDFTGGIKGDQGQVLHSDNIINRAWDTYNFLIAYMEKYFGDIFQRNSVIRRFMKENLSEWFEDGVNNFDFFKKINADGAFDAADFQKKMMVYKQKGVPTTATVCRWEPIYCDAGESPYDDDNFDLNFSRINFDADTEEEVLKSAKEHVRLTPTMFDSICEYDTDEERAKSTPTVMNAIGSASVLIDTDGVNTPLRTPLGQFASMLDRAMGYASKNPDNNVVQTVGAIPDDVKDEFVLGSDKACVIFDKDPENIWVSTLPLVDCTDPYQCGWNVIISAESVHPNVWEKYFCNFNNYLKSPNSNDTTDEYTPTAGSGTSASPNSHNSLAFKMATNKKNMIAHVVNPDYLGMVKHAKIFIGDAIWEVPEAIATRYQSGNYPEVMTFARDGEAGADATDLRTLLLDHIAGWVHPQALAEGDLENMDPDDIIQYMLGLASCPNDPSIPEDAIEHIMSPYDWLQNWWNTFKDLVLSDWEVWQWTFAPNYGPVCPVVYEIPAHLPATAPSLDVLVGDKSDTEYSIETSDDDSVGMAPSVMMQGAAQGFYMWSARLQFAIDSMINSGQYLLWFLDNFSFTKTSKSRWDMYLADTKVDLPGFSGPAKHAFALLARGAVYHMGHENFDSVFQDTSRFKAENPSYDFGLVKIDMGNLVLPPKTSVKKIEGARLTSWRDRGVSVHKVTTYAAYNAGKNDTSGESPDKKQSSFEKERKSSPVSGKSKGKTGYRKSFDKKNREPEDKDSELVKDIKDEAKALDKKVDLPTV